MQGWTHLKINWFSCGFYRVLKSICPHQFTFGFQANEWNFTLLLTHIIYTIVVRLVIEMGLLNAWVSFFIMLVFQIRWASTFLICKGFTFLLVNLENLHIQCVILCFWLVDRWNFFKLIVMTTYRFRINQFFAVLFYFCLFVKLWTILTHLLVLLLCTNILAFTS